MDDDDFAGDDFGDTDDAETETVPCPYCRKPIPEDTPRCPYCGNYISLEDPPPSRKPWWIILGALGAIFVIYRWITQP